MEKMNEEDVREYLALRETHLSMYITGLMNSKKNHPDTWTQKDERELVFALGHRREAQSIATKLLQTSKMTLPESIAKERKKIGEMKAFKKKKATEKLCKGCGLPLKDHAKIGMRILLVKENE
jgi:hypothetical protein